MKKIKMKKNYKIQKNNQKMKKMMIKKMIYKKKQMN